MSAQASTRVEQVPASDPTDSPVARSGPRARRAQTYAVLNPGYPASYWQIAFSTDIARGKAIPLRVLERDVVLWRDSTGEIHCSSAHCGHLGAHLGYGSEVVGETLRCAFHAWQYNGEGKVVAIPGVQGTPRTKACLQTYRVYERYGTVFVWNGPSEPDHELPNPLADAGLTAAETVFEHCRFKLPFAGKMLMENLPDAAHFGALHGVGTWGDTDTITHTPTTIEFIAHFYGRAPYLRWADIRRNYQRGEMFGIFDVFAGDLRSITYGGGLHLVQVTEPTQELLDRQREVKKFLPRLAIAAGTAVNKAADKSAFILSFTPVDADSHILFATFFIPKIKNPVLRAVSKPLIKELAVRRNWFAAWQDTAVMLHRQEPESPGYQKFDRGLIELRRFWDDRVAVSAGRTPASASHGITAPHDK